MCFASVYHSVDKEIGIIHDNVEDFESALLMHRA